jgi:transcription antitermination factor NusG
MDKKAEFSEGDIVRVKQGAFASFFGKLVKVNNESERLTVQGRFKGQPDSELHTLNVDYSVVEKLEGNTNSLK